MNKNLHHYRKTYTRGCLLENEISQNPFILFQNWFEEVEKTLNNNPLEVNAMNVSTIGEDGFPKNRIVLLKEYNKEGFIFYTNYTSEKGHSLEKKPHLCISFFWPALERQVIIKGTAQKTSEEMATAYFKSRPRGSQLGAWASNQSSEIASREVLEKCLKELETKYEGQEIPKPDFWGGFTVIPKDFEFWQGRPNRLHDRIYYYKENSDWKFKRLAP
ncbi:MAG: pyridoxamine 5'-phosphate oxidase [Gillisia sp.]